MGHWAGGGPEAAETLRASAADELALRESRAAWTRPRSACARIRPRLPISTGTGEGRDEAGCAGDNGRLACAWRWRNLRCGRVSKPAVPARRVRVTALGRLEAQHGLLRGPPRPPRDLRSAGPSPGHPSAARSGIGPIETERTRAGAPSRRRRSGCGNSTGAWRVSSGRRPAHARCAPRARAVRDRGWVRVLAAWKDGAEEGELDGRPLAEAYPMTVRRRTRSPTIA